MDIAALKVNKPILYIKMIPGIIDLHAYVGRGANRSGFNCTDVKM